MFCEVVGDVVHVAAEIGIDPQQAQARITQLIEACDAVRPHEFVFTDVPLLGLASTDTFDRAVHTFAWTTVQVTTGSSYELIDGAGGIAETVRTLSDLDSDVSERLVHVRGELDVAGS